MSAVLSFVANGIGGVFNILTTIILEIVEFIKSVGSKTIELALENPKIMVMLLLLIAYWFY